MRVHGLILAFSALALLVVIFFFWTESKTSDVGVWNKADRETTSEENAVIEQAPSTTTSKSNEMDNSSGEVDLAALESEVSNASPEEFSGAIQSFFAGLENVSNKVVLSAREKLEAPLAALDYDEIAKALVEIVYRDPWDESEVVEILEELADHEDKWVRYRAIEYLYKMGQDVSAKASAIEIISSASFVENPTGSEEDLRITLANALGPYRDIDLLPAIVELYENTGSRRLRDDLMRISPTAAWEIFGGDIQPRASQTVLEWLGMAQVERHKGFVSEVYNDQERDAEIRNAGAWAMTRIGDDPDAAKLIRDYAQKGSGENFGRLSIMKDSIIYLGTLSDEESVGVLENIARSSTSGPIVDVAVANLVINHQSRSSAGKELIVEELIGGGTPLGRELAITLAAYMSDDPEIRAAGEMSDQRGSVDSWRNEGIDRKDWAFWGWADQYLIIPPLE